MREFITYIGMDTDSKGYDIALAEEIGSSRGSEVRSYGRIEASNDALDRLIRKLEKAGHKHLHFIYEAGPCGYTIYRHLKRCGIACSVVAPTLIPKRAGDRVKTNRRDAINLVRLARAGELTEVWVPEEEDEAMRDLTRARNCFVEEATRIKLRIKSFLMLYGIKYQGQQGKSWSSQYRTWLEGLKLEPAPRAYVLEELRLALWEAEQRIERMERRIEEELERWRMNRVVKALEALRGVKMITAVGLVSEIGDITRFDSPRALMGYMGLVSSEYSTGDKRRQAEITKCGNRHARKMMVESSWSYARGRGAHLSQALKRRQKGLSARVIEISWQAQVRLCGRYRRLTSRGKHSCKAVVAVARELCGFMWAIAMAVKEEQGGSMRAPRPEMPAAAAAAAAAAATTVPAR